MTKQKRESRGHDQAPSKWLLIAAFAAVYVIWGSTYLGIKYAIETLPPLLMAGARYIIAGMPLYLWARFVRKDAKPQPAHWRTSFIVGALLLLIGNGGVVWAEHSISSSLAALLVATEPLWIVLLNWARPGGERPGVKVAFGLLMGFAGVWLLIDQGTWAGKEAGGGVAPIFGAALVIAAAFSWACGSVYLLRAPAPASPMLASGMQMLAGGTLLLVAGTLSGEWTRFDLGHASARSVTALLYLVICGSIIAFTAYSWLLRNTSPARAATYAYVNPVVAMLLGWAVAGETVTTRTLFGAGVIVASIALITSYGKRQPVESNGDGEGNRAASSKVEKDRLAHLKVC